MYLYAKREHVHHIGMIIVLTSIWHYDVISTSVRRHYDVMCPLGSTVWSAEMLSSLCFSVCYIHLVLMYIYLQIMDLMSVQ